MERLLIIDDINCKKEVEQFLKKHDSSIKLNSVAINHLVQVGDTKRILINTASTVYLINVNEIIRCQSNRNYTELYLTKGRKLTVSKPLKNFEQLKSMRDFVRVHLSHFVNVNYIDRLIKTGSGTLVLTDGTKLPVSVRRKDNWMDKLEIV